MLSFEVRHLAEGYASADWIDRVASPAMHAHLRLLSWPSDLATPDSGFMIVRESTHRASLLSQHRATIGIQMPMLVTSLGRAWLAACSAEEREATLSILRERPDSMGAMARDSAYVQRVLRETRRRGYAVNKSEWLAQSSMSAIALPIIANGQAIGAINLAMPSNAISEREIASKYVPRLRALVEEIARGV